MRKASLVDVEQLVTMMAEFYSDSPYTLNLIDSECGLIIERRRVDQGALMPESLLTLCS